MVRHVLAALAVCAAMAGSAVADKTNTIHSFAGPYITYVERLYPCGDVNVDDTTSIRWPYVSHFNPVRPFDLQLVTSSLSTKRGFDDTNTVESRLASWSNNQWKQNALVFRFPSQGCSVGRTHAPGLFRALFGDRNITTASAPCRIPPGRYLTNHTVDWTFPHFPVVPYGRYRCQMMVGSRGVQRPHFCVYIEGRAIPRPSRRS